jgi:hypothetical protein
MAGMRIIVVNVNSSEPMTGVIGEAARRHASAGTETIARVGAAVRLAEAIVGLGLRTSKVSTYAAPDPKKITAWPLSIALGLRPVAAEGGPASRPAGAEAR